MEGRLMLADLGLDLTIWSQPGQFAVFGAERSLVVAEATEGGFISVQYLGPEVQFSAPAIPGSLPDVAFDGDFLHSGNGIYDALIDRFHERRAELDKFSFDKWELFDSHLSDRFRAIVIDSQFNVDTGPSIQQLPSAEHVETTASLDEGGTIAIEAIFASKELNEGMKPNPRPATTVVRQLHWTDPTATLASVPIAQPTRMSAEWARAIVFETAGGDPLELQPVANQAKTPKPKSVPPNDAQDADNIPASATHAIPNEQQLPFDKPGKAKLLDSDRSALCQPPLPLPAQTAATSLPLYLTVQNSGETMLKPAAIQSPDSAKTKAFDQLIENEKAGAHWLTNYSRRALGASPFLLVLALERVAAHKSRRRGVQNPGRSPSARSAATASDPSDHWKLETR